MRPATRVGRWILYPDGFHHKVSYWRYLLLKLKIKRTVRR